MLILLHRNRDRKPQLSCLQSRGAVHSALAYLKAQYKKFSENLHNILNTQIAKFYLEIYHGLTIGLYEKFL